MVESQETNYEDFVLWDAAAAEAWPDGVPLTERALWLTLTRENREIAITRLRALTRYEEERDLRARMRDTGLSKAGFFSLLNRWRRERSVASLLPRVGGISRAGPVGMLPHALLPVIRETVRNRGSWPVEALVDYAVAALPKDGPAVERRTIERAVPSIVLDAIVSDLLTAHPDWSKYRVVEEARSRLHSPPAASTVRRVVERLRSAPVKQIDDGRASGVGTRIVIASCPAVRRSSRSTEDEIWAKVGLVVDVATRTILGAAASQGAFDAMRAAAEQAADFCEGLAAGTPTNERSVIEVHVPAHADPLVLMRQTTAVGRIATWEQADEPTDRTTPSVLINLVGRTLGVLDLRPRGAPGTAREEPDIVAELLARHLGSVRDSPLDLPSASVPPATLAAALRAFAAP